MESCVSAKLASLGYSVNTAPYSYIDVCDSWYCNELIDDFHKRTTIQGETYEIDRMNFAKRGCADDANLCEVVSVNVGEQANSENGNTQSEQIKSILNKNRFDVMYRKQLEKMSADGTVAAYVWIDNATYLDNGKVTGGSVKIAYCYAESYIPLKIENDEVLEVAFYGTNISNNEKKTTLVLFTRNRNMYKAETYIFDKNGKEIANYWLQLGEVKPFAVMRVAEVNNIKNMEGFGLPKLWGAIPILKKLDLCNMVLNGDLEKGEKMILTNEAIVEIDKETKKPKKTPLMKRLFVFLGEKLPTADAVIKEYNPEIRIDTITKTFELCLSMFSMLFGFGTKKYKFDDGQIQTATQYIGERQDAMQELNRQRKEAADYIRNIVTAVMWFSNVFCGTAFDMDAEICIDFDDSYIEDKNTKTEGMREDAQSFSEIPEFTIRYIMARLNMDRDEAVKIMNAGADDADPEEED